ncbi:MAG TPA: hypothetical protein DCW90_06360 [Lachnospiraceae bacterium]|nr:hypothetical protein [uncultured Lachnoclostridium sp.]HAU85121.1 hypothetical protein [Lachnospiraceae bacterium]
MKIQELKALNEQEQVKFINNRLAELEEKKLTEKEFKCELLSFSYNAATKHMEEMGYELRDGRFIKRLTASEIEALRRMLDHENLFYRAFSLGAKININRNDEVQATTVRVYKQVWEDWNQFCKEKSAISKEELLTTALEQFMRDYR